ncbi:glucose dehydrogenase [Aspergillus flavus AF70]|nr:glucose dehydrogenase [Aspergillus flavus AF70]
MVFSSMAAMVPLGFGVGALQGGTFSAHLHWVFGSTAIVCAPCTVAAYWAVPTLPPSSGLAGKNLVEDPRVQTPALWTTLMGSEADWQFQTTPQTILGDRVIKEPQGKMLGGSSGINGQAFVAPTKAGIDGWAKLGATNWT